MKSFLLSTSIFASLVTFFACTKSTPVVPKIYDVYVSGDSTFGTNQIVKYWKNGIPVDLSNGKTQGQPSSMFVSGSDVYVAGSLFDNISNQIFATAWKNGTGVTVSTGPYGTTLNSVKVSGTDVYYGGSVFTTSQHPVATYWKNGMPVSVSDGSSSGTVQDMAVSGSDLYLLIILDNSNYINASIWKNGVVTNLYTGSGKYADAAEFGEMVVDNADVYAATSIPSSTGNMIAAYNKNGTITKLSDSTGDNYSISLCLAGKDIYVAGTVGVKTGGREVYRATYWKNGTVVYLTDGTNDANALSIKVIGNDVYVAGSEFNGKNYVAKYWKNGVAVILSHGTTDSYASNIVVVQR